MAGNPKLQATTLSPIQWVDYVERRHSLVVRIPRCGRGDLGSIPSGVIIFLSLFFRLRVNTHRPDYFGAGAHVERGRQPRWRPWRRREVLCAHKSVGRTTRASGLESAGRSVDARARLAGRYEEAGPGLHGSPKEGGEQGVLGGRRGNIFQKIVRISLASLSCHCTSVRKKASLTQIIFSAGASPPATPRPVENNFDCSSSLVRRKIVTVTTPC